MMLILLGIENSEKLFDYIVKIIDYEIDEHGDYVINKWENLFGTPYVNISGNLYGNRTMVREDKDWIKTIFEHLIVGEKS